jgi:hypothetical protein
MLLRHIQLQLSLLANKCLSVVFPAVSDVTMGLRIP